LIFHQWAFGTAPSKAAGCRWCSCRSQ
jgi:hypothetical protein